MGVPAHQLGMIDCVTQSPMMGAKFCLLCLIMKDITEDGIEVTDSFISLSNYCQAQVHPAY